MFDIEKIYRKPIFPIQDYLNFNCVGCKVNNHPIIIFEYGDDIVFLTAQSATYKNGKLKISLDGFLKDKYNNNQLYILEKTNDLNIRKKGLFQKMSMVDTTSLFVMNKDDFEKCYNVDNQNLYATRKINLFDWSNLMEQVKNNIKNNNIAINRVFIKEFNNDIVDTYTCTIFANKEILKKELEHIQSKISLNEFSKIEKNIKELSNDNNIKDDLLNLFNNEFKKTNDLLLDGKNSIFPEIDEYEIIGSSTNYNVCIEKSFNISVENAVELDFETQLEIESFSDFEKEYYKQNPKEFDDKYWTYLDQLKTQYNEWKQEQTKQQDKGFEM